VWVARDPDSRVTAKALLRCRVGRQGGPWFGLRSDRLGEFGERGGDPQCGRYVQAQFVVAASKVWLDYQVDASRELGG
jgi:hypothetical protein